MHFFKYFVALQLLFINSNSSTIRKGKAHIKKPMKMEIEKKGECSREVNPTEEMITNFYAKLYRELGKPTTKRYGATEHTFSQSNFVEKTFEELDSLCNNIQKNGKLEYSSKVRLTNRQYVTFIEHKDDIDEHGITIEWFWRFSSEAFNPKMKLFRFSNDKDDTVEICPSYKNCFDKNRLRKYTILGLFTAFAIYHKRLLNVHFSVPFLKGILKKTVVMTDIAKTDPGIYQFLENVKKHKKPLQLNLKFTAPDPTDPEKIHNLFLGSQFVPVGLWTKESYIKSFIKFRYEELVKQETLAFAKGFFSLIPDELLKTIDEQTLQLIIAGEEKIDLEHWKTITEYDSYCKDAPKTIEWFWTAINDLNDKERSKLLQFVTGTTRIPAESVQKFTFKISCNPVQTYIHSSTCYNVLYLPKCDKYKHFLQMVKTAVEHSQGFYKK